MTDRIAGLWITPVLADEPTANLSGGVRLVAYLGEADVYVALAKQWRELALMGGVSWAFDEVKLQTEVWWGAWDLARDEVVRPRATVGLDLVYLDLAAWF